MFYARAVDDPTRERGWTLQMPRGTGMYERSHFSYAPTRQPQLSMRGSPAEACTCDGFACLLAEDSRGVYRHALTHWSGSMPGT